MQLPRDAIALVGHGTSSLRLAVAFGCNGPSLGEIRERLPHLRLWNFYGQTEMAPLASALGPDEQDAHAGAAGRPVAVAAAIGELISELRRPIHTQLQGTTLPRPLLGVPRAHPPRQLRRRRKIPPGQPP